MPMQDVLRLSKWRGGGHMLARCRRFTVPGGEAPGVSSCAQPDSQSAISYRQCKYRERAADASRSACQRAVVVVPVADRSCAAQDQHVRSVQCVVAWRERRASRTRVFCWIFRVSKVVAPGPRAGRARGSPRVVLAPGTAQEEHRLTTGPCMSRWPRLVGAVPSRLAENALAPGSARTSTTFFCSLPAGLDGVDSVGNTSSNCVRAWDSDYSLKLRFSLAACILPWIQWYMGVYV